MNIFKGLLFLHGYIDPADFRAEPADQPRRQFGARTAAGDFVAPLGNRAASERAFGQRKLAAAPTQLGCVAGGCG